MLKTFFSMMLISASLFSNIEWEDYQNRVLSQGSTIPGWCNQGKAKKMMNLIHETKPTICVEVGVFGGSSIFPTACSLKYLKQGVVYAIDPWANDDCLEGYSEGNPNYEWWSNINLEDIYLGFTTLIKDHELNPYCVVMRTSGQQASEIFPNESIDILHIDGNHTEEASLRDVEIYLPKMKKGGYIWFDDVNWLSTRKAWEYLSSFCEKDEELSTDEYFLFKVKP